MRRLPPSTLLISIFAITVLALASGSSGHAQSSPAPAQPQAPAGQRMNKPLPPLYPLDDAYLDWPLSASDKAYGAIDGKRLKTYVSDLAAISRRYRDQGHQLWGRISGTSADVENQEWLLDKFKKAGLSDVHAQSFDLPPQWLAQTWDVTASGNGKTVHLQTAQPVYMTPATSKAGLDLEAVYVGLGSEADFAGRDVKGKAVFVFSIPYPGMWYNTAAIEGGLRRAEAKGAAAVFDVLLLPGNIRTELYPTGTNIPTFCIGMEDGYAMRDLIQSSIGAAPRVSIHLDVEMAPNLKTATIWGTLPGMTDERIYIVGHRDGWFEGATDDASGVATMVGLAEYFGKMPKDKRRRTMIFLGTTGHHNNGSISSRWIADHHEEVFAKTALIINCEHTATTQTYFMRGNIRKANTTNEANFWYTGGSAKLVDISIKAYHSFGVPTYAEPEPTPAGEMGAFYQFAPSLQLIDVGMFSHTDSEKPDAVPWTGLAAVTRAYAKIITEVNGLEIKDLQRSGPAGSQP